MNIFLEFDWFLGFGIRLISAEYWRMLVIHFPFIALNISIPREQEEDVEVEDDIEERRRL